MLHKRTSVRHGMKAQGLGVDGIGIDGFECAGHPGEDDVPGLVLIPAAAKQIEIPMIASGFDDARGSGRGVGVGGRWHQHGHAVHVHRGVVHPSERQGSHRGRDERGTELIFRTLQDTARVARNVVSRGVVEILKGGGQFEDGDLDAGIWTVGTVMGSIDDIPTCGSRSRES